MKKVSEQSSTLRVLAFAAAISASAFLFAPVVSTPPALGQEQTTNTTTARGIPETVELHEQQQLSRVIIDNEPLYQSISGNLTSTRIVDVVSTSVVIEEESFVERAIMKDIGNVTNTGTYVENIDYTRGIVNGAGKGIITTEDGVGGRDMISWNAYDIGLLSGYGRDNRNSDDTTGSSALNTEKIRTYRGIIFFNTDSDRLSFMNNVVGLYITQVNNENGSSLRQIWEWRNNY